MAPPASKKRKLGEEKGPKYYAVRAGRIPGVYMSWQECQEHTTGFKGASYKSFLNEKDARDFIAGKSRAAPGEEKFYGVAVGHRPGVYTDWADANEQIMGAEKPKYKKFETRKEAEAFVKSGGLTAAIKSESKKATKAGYGDEKEEPTPKKAKTKSGPTIKIYTDGSALGNGRIGSVAGVGVFFGVGDPRNISEPLEGEAQTNNRAELTAILRALQIAPKNKDIEIVTDSNYSINCATVWFRNWAAKGWKTSTGQPAENQDLIKAVRALIDERDGNGNETKFTWIKGHNDDPGNTAADKLAVAGAHDAQTAGLRYGGAAM